MAAPFFARGADLQIAWMRVSSIHAGIGTRGQHVTATESAVQLRFR